MNNRQDRAHARNSSIDFKGIAAAALASAKSLLQEWLPDGRFEGREYVALNPTRNDKTPGSFKINWQTGEWSDFADPNAKGGDLISLFAYINNLDQGQAARQIAERLGSPAHHGAAPPTETTPLIHPWGEEGPPVGPDEVRRHYYPKNTEPKLKVKIKRRHVPKHKAWLTCYRVVRDGTPIGWQWKKPANYRSVPYAALGTDRQRIFWPEGEKDNDTLNKFGFSAFTFGGGDGVPSDIDEYLKVIFRHDRPLIIPIDNDVGGRRQGEEKARKADACGIKHIRIFDPAQVWPECPEGGDITDWFERGGGTRESLIEIVNALPDWQPSANNDKPDADGWRTSVLQASNLQRMTFPLAREIVPGYIPEGATLLVGKPKIGKSWLTLDLCIASTANRFVLGTIKPVQGEVLYLALEDSPRRIKKRILKLWPSTLAKWPEQLHLTNSWRRADECGIEDIAEWCQSVPNPVMVVIDTLEKFRAPADGRKGAYSADYEAVAALQKLALERRIAVVIVHHDRKMDADDPFDTVSGTLGLTGAADTILIVKRKAGAVTLHARGRDIEEKETALQFEKRTCRWTILGAASEVHVSSERAAVLQALKPAGKGGLSVRELMAATETENRNAMDKLLFKMVKEGRLVRLKQGVYAVAETDLPEESERKIGGKIDEDPQDIEDAGNSPNIASDLPDLPDLPEIREIPDRTPDPIPTTQNQGGSGRLGRSRDGDPQAVENTENIEPRDLPDNLPEILPRKIEGGTTVIDL